MDVLTAVGRFLLDLVLYLVNGLLEILYQVIGHLAVLVGLICGLAILLVFDVLAQRLAAAAPARQGQKPSLQVSRHHQALTVATILAWLVVGLAFPTPVPQLGAAMWGLTILALLLIPAEQVAILWRSKVAILSYCGLLVAFRVVAAWTLAADPREWAAIIGTVGEAQRVVASSRGLVLSIASYVSWFAIPAGYVVYLFQKATTHPMSLRNPLARASEVAWQIRQRPD